MEDISTDPQEFIDRTVAPTNQKVTVGQRVYSMLYGGRDGIVFAIHGNQSPETVGSLAGVVSFGGSASYDIVFENGTESHGLPEAILRGVQWHIYKEIARPEEIAFLREKVTIESARRKADEGKKQQEFAAAVAALRTNPDYAHLTQGEDVHSGKLAASNIRKELKRVFPTVKFSVRKAHYGSVDVSWLDGPRTKEVDKIVSKYRSGHFNGMEDIYETHSTSFNAVFGGAKYAFCQRSISVARFKEAASHIAVECGLPVLVVQDAGDHGYVERSGVGEQVIRYSIHLDFETGAPTLCRDEQGECYSQVVTQWAYGLSY